MQIQINDEVCYSSAFLKSISAHTGWYPFAQGKVTNLIDLGGVILADINWNDGNVGKVNVYNLWPVKMKHLEPA